MKTSVSSEVDEKNLILEWPDGVAQRSDQGGPRYLLGEHGRWTPGRVPNGGWTSAQRRVDGCPMESEWVPDRGQVSGVARRGSI
jgi:hypothetical protein